jgi:hypothetical protein
VVELVVEKDSASGREVITWARMEADGVTPGRRHTFLRVVEGPPRSEVVRGRGLRGKQPRAGG